MTFGNGYGGYGGYGVSPYGPIAGSNPAASPFYYPGMAPGKDEFVGLGGKHKKKGLEGFFQGIYNGAANMIKGIFSVQGLAMTAATAGLVWATGGAALIPLAALGGGIGGFQMLKGIGQGSAEGFGEGVFTTAASILGLKFTPKTVKMDGKTFTLGKPGEKLGLMGRLKALWGGEKYRSEGESLSVWQAGSQKLQSRFHSADPSKGALLSPEKLNPANWRGLGDVENLERLKMTDAEFKGKYFDLSQKFKEGKGLASDSKNTALLAKEKAEFNAMKTQAKLPEKQSFENYLGEDHRLRSDISALENEKTAKGIRSVFGRKTDIDVSIIDEQIAALQAERTNLFNQFKTDHIKAVEGREKFMGLTDEGRLQMTKSSDGVRSYKPSEETTIADGKGKTDSAQTFEEKLAQKESQSEALRQAGLERDVAIDLNRRKNFMEQDSLNEASGINESNGIKKPPLFRRDSF